MLTLNKKPVPRDSYEFVVTETFHGRGPDGKDLFVSYPISVPSNRVLVFPVENGYGLTLDQSVLAQQKRRADDVMFHPIRLEFVR